MAVNQNLVFLYENELGHKAKKTGQVFEPHLRRAFAKANDPYSLAHHLANSSAGKYIIRPDKNGLIAKIKDGRWPNAEFSKEDLENSPSYKAFCQDLERQGIEIKDVEVLTSDTYKEGMEYVTGDLTPATVPPCIYFDLRPSQALAEAVSIRQEEQRRKETDRRLTPSPIAVVHGEGGSIPKPNL